MQRRILMIVSCAAELAHQGPVLPRYSSRRHAPLRGSSTHHGLSPLLAYPAAPEARAQAATGADAPAARPLVREQARTGR